MIHLPSTCFTRRGVASPLTVPLASDGDGDHVVSPTSKSIAKEELGANESLALSKLSGSTESSRSLHRSRFFLQHETSAVLQDVYELEDRPLGKGAFGTVWRARVKGQEVPWNRVIKTLNKSKTGIEKIKREAMIMKSLDHPQVCRAFETFEDPRYFHIVLELIEGQDLFAFVFGFVSKGELLKEHMAAAITKQVLQGLHYCHSEGILHRDLKPENIMVQDIPGCTKPHIKIIDFGLAIRNMPAERTPNRRFVGTYAYAAPEVKQGKVHSPASDLWSAGMIVHVLLLGGLPCDAVCDGDMKLDVWGEPGYKMLSGSAQDFLHAFLQIDPRRRLAAARIEMTNQYSWTNAVLETAENQVHMSSDVLDSFVRFQRGSLLQKAVVTATALQLLETLPVQDIKDQFVSLDFDGNGRLSKAELSRSMARQATRTVAEDIASCMDAVFDSLDTDASGQLEYSEFLAAALDAGSFLSNQAILAAFRVFDIDSSGKIDALEFARVLDIMPEEIANCMKEFDADNDGEINLTEFKAIVLQPSHCLTTCSQHSSMGRRVWLL